jgi:hypothetical protein
VCKQFYHKDKHNTQCVTEHRHNWILLLHVSARMCRHVVTGQQQADLAVCTGCWLWSWTLHNMSRNYVRISSLKPELHVNCTLVCYEHVSLFPAPLTLRHYRHEQTKRTWQPESAGRQTAEVQPLAGLEIRRWGPLCVPWTAAVWCRRRRLKHDAVSYGTVKTKLQRRHSMKKHTVCQGVLYYPNVTQCHGTQVHVPLRL